MNGTAKWVAASFLASTSSTKKKALSIPQTKSFISISCHMATKRKMEGSFLGSLTF